MAEIQDNTTAPKRGRRKENRPARIDMTPMVDLAFLLLTFFILATTLAKPKVMELNFPKETVNKTPVKDTLAHVFLLGVKDEVWYYHGMFREGKTKLERVNLDKDGLRKLILEKNRNDQQHMESLVAELKAGRINREEYTAGRKSIQNDPRAPYFIIKTIEKTPYGKIVDVIDELQIGDVSKYVVVDMTEPEKAAMESSRSLASR
jgi:biopolymer transport protein ExbD